MRVELESSGGEGEQVHLLSFLQIAGGYGRHTLELAASNCFYYTLLWSEELEVEREKQRKEGPKLVMVSRVSS